MPEQSKQCVLLFRRCQLWPRSSLVNPGQVKAALLPASVKPMLLNVVPSSQTLAQHYANIRSMFRICLPPGYTSFLWKWKPVLSNIPAGLVSIQRQAPVSRYCCLSLHGGQYASTRWKKRILQLKDTAVAAYFTSKQLLLFDFLRQRETGRWQKRIMKLNDKQQYSGGQYASTRWQKRIMQVSSYCCLSLHGSTQPDDRWMMGHFWQLWASMVPRLRHRSALNPVSSVSDYIMNLNLVDPVLNSRRLNIHWPHVLPMLGQCWTSVYDVGLMLFSTSYPSPNCRNSHLKMNKVKYPYFNICLISQKKIVMDSVYLSRYNYIVFKDKSLCRAAA